MDLQGKQREPAAGRKRCCIRRRVPTLQGRRRGEWSVGSSEDAISVEAEELPFRQLAQTLPNLCWISDSDGQIVWVNDAWTAYTGMDVAAIRTRGLAEIHDP